MATGKLHEVKPSAIGTVVSAIFSQKSHSHPCDYLLIVMTNLHSAQVVTTVQFKT